MRLFVGLWPPDFVLEILLGVQATLRRLAPTAPLRLTRGEQLHLTLQFLGDVRDDRLEPFAADLRRALSDHAAIALGVSGIGVFPTPDRARVVWAGVMGDCDSLMKLQRAVAGVAARHFSLPDEAAFHPHVTLARVLKPAGRERQEWGPVLRTLECPAVPGWNAASVRLMRSELRPEGARYSVVAEIPLATTR